MTRRISSGRALAPLLFLAAAVAVADAEDATEGAGGLAPSPSWVLRYDPGGLDLGEGIAIAAGGDVYVTGIADDGGDQDFVTLKIDRSGAIVWSSTIDEGPKDRGEDVAVDPAGNVVVAGTTRGLAGDDALVRKYAPNGTLLWTRLVDKGTSETARAVATDGAGNVLVAGASLSMNGCDGFVAKLDADGKELWARAVNVVWCDEAFDAAVDDAGNVAVAGRLVRSSQFDLLARKFSPDGAVLWTRIAADPGRDEARGAAFDREGALYLVGTTTTLAGGNATLDLLVAKHAAGGDLLWSRSIDLGGAQDEGRDVALDASGNLLVTGFAAGAGGKDGVLVKLDPQGREIWRATWDGGAVDGFGAVAVAPEGRIVVAGAAQREGDEFDYLVVAFDDAVPSGAFSARSDGAGPDEVARSGAPVAFTDASVPGRAPLARWDWDFGDGNRSSEANPSHVYAYGGSYTVRLRVSDASGNSDEVARVLAVSGPPPPPGNDGGATSPEEPPSGVEESLAPVSKAAGILLATGLTLALASAIALAIALRKRRRSP